MNEKTLDELWEDVKHVGKVEHLEYDAMVALGSVFGKMKHTILKQQTEIEILKDALEDEERRKNVIAKDWSDVIGELNATREKLQFAENHIKELGIYVNKLESY